MSTHVSQLIHGVLYRKKLSSTPLEYRALALIGAALEVHNWKAAQEAIAKQLKKQPEHYLVHALKCVALSGPRPMLDSSRTEILSSVEYVKSHANGAGLRDPEVLLVLGWVLGMMWKADEITSIMNLAIERHPNSEDVNVEAFCHYVRAGERRSAQQTSMRMSKSFKQPHYLWWSVASILLQARTPDDTSNALLLSLAERQLVGHYSSLPAAAEKQRYGSAHEFFLVTRFLELRAQQTETISTMNVVLPSVASQGLSARQTLLRHLESSEADRFCAAGLGLEIWRREVELREGSTEGGEWKRSWERLKKSLEEGDTNWHTMLYMIRCAFALADDSSAAYSTHSADIFTPPRAEPTSVGQSLIEETRALLFQFSEGLHASSAPNERGYLLGVLEVARENRRREWNEGKERLGFLVEQYFERFSTKMCSFDDLTPYLEVLDEAEGRIVRERMEDRGKKEGELTEKATLALINAAKIARYLSPPPSSAEAQLAIAHSYLTRYFQVLPLGAHLDKTDLQVADDFALLAGEAFISAHYLSHDRSHLESALLVLEYALQRSKHKYQTRLLSINLLRLLGASSLALAHYRTLGVKSIQHDTLAHIIATRAATFAVSPGPASSSDVGLLDELTNAKRWYTVEKHEAAEMVVRAFSLNSYSKIEDFVDFETRLNTSLSKDLVHLEALRSQLLRGATLDVDALEQVRSILKRCNEVELSDNRDFNTIPDFQAKNEKTIWQQTGSGPRPGQAWLRALASVYERFLDPTKAVDADQTSVESEELSPPELALLGFSRLTRNVFSAALDDAEPEKAAVAFFQDQAAVLTSAIEDSTRLPYEIISIAQASFEAYCLLDLSLGIFIGHLTSTKAINHAKHAKRLRNFRTKARESTQKIGKEVTNWAKKVGKERNKVNANVAQLKQFESFDDDHVMNWAHALVESRRSSAEALGSAIHRRCIK